MTRALAAALSAFALFATPAVAPYAFAEEAGHEHAEDHDHEHEEADHSHHEGEADGVMTVHAWTRATPDRIAYVFVDIENKSDKDIAITGGHTDVADAVELVGFQLKDGEPTYVALPPVPIRAGTEMTLAPNGLALRLNGLKTPLVKGEEYEIEIEFDFGHIEMFFQVEDANARTHSHVGHVH